MRKFGYLFLIAGCATATKDTGLYLSSGFSNSDDDNYDDEEEDYEEEEA